MWSCFVSLLFALLVVSGNWSRADGVVLDRPDPRKHDKVDDGYQRTDLRAVVEEFHPAAGQLLEPRVSRYVSLFFLSSS